MALISIIIPCHNVAPHIDRCLQSIIVQTTGLCDLEIICVDDASTDNTLEKLLEWETRIPNNLVLVPLDHNCRQGAARNIGLNYASGEWIAFVDSDDWLEPDYIEKLYSISLKSECDVIICGMDRDPSDSLTYYSDRTTGKEDCYMYIDSHDKRNHFIIFNSMGNYVWGRLIRKSLLIENQIFFPEFLVYEDTFWGSLLHLYANKVYFLEEKLYHYYVNPTSTVLSSASEHHLDLLTVQIILWREWEKRGFLNIYREALEYDFLHSCYFSFIKVLAYRYSEPSYSLFQLSKELVYDRIPLCINNSFLSDSKLPKLYRFLLESLSLPMNRDEFKQFILLVKAIGL